MYWAADVHSSAIRKKMERRSSARMFNALWSTSFTTTGHTTTNAMSVSPFSSAHRLYVKSLYRRMLKNELDWIVRRDLWRAKAQQIRADFEANR